MSSLLNNLVSRMLRARRARRLVREVKTKAVTLLWRMLNRMINANKWKLKMIRLVRGTADSNRTSARNWTSSIDCTDLRAPNRTSKRGIEHFITTSGIVSWQIIAHVGAGLSSEAALEGLKASWN